MKTLCKIINTSSNPLPQYATRCAAGADIRADLRQAVTLMPMERMAVPTGLFVELPEGYELQIRPRSGLALKSGITVLNAPGTIDADYRGEIKVILINLSEQPFVIEHGDRIAQMILSRHETIAWEEVTALNETDRAEQGFGSSGIH